MEHPVLYLKVVTDFLDRLIEEQGHILYIVFLYFCVGLIIWMLTRQRKHPVHDNFTVIILPLGLPPRKEPEHRSRLFEDHNSL
jgi:hypothetical protein